MGQQVGALMFVVDDCFVARYLEFSVLGGVVQRSPAPAVSQDLGVHEQQTLQDAMMSLTGSEVQRRGSVCILARQVHVCERRLRSTNTTIRHAYYKSALHHSAAVNRFFFLMCVTVGDVVKFSLRRRSFMWHSEFLRYKRNKTHVNRNLGIHTGGSCLYV